MRHVGPRAQAARRREGDERTFAASHFELSSVRIVGVRVMMFGNCGVVNGGSSIWCECCRETRCREATREGKAWHAAAASTVQRRFPSLFWNTHPTYRQRPFALLAGLLGAM